MQQWALKSGREGADWGLLCTCATVSPGGKLHTVPELFLKLTCNLKQVSTQKLNYWLIKSMEMYHSKKGDTIKKEFFILVINFFSHWLTKKNQVKIMMLGIKMGTMCEEIKKKFQISNNF